MTYLCKSLKVWTAGDVWSGSPRTCCGVNTLLHGLYVIRNVSVIAFVTVFFFYNFYSLAQLAWRLSVKLSTPRVRYFHVFTYSELFPNSLWRRHADLSSVSLRGRTAPLTSKVSFYIFIQQIYVLNILNVVYTLWFLSLQNAVCFIILSYLVPVLFTFLYTGCAKIKKNNSGTKRLTSGFVAYGIFTHLGDTVVKVLCY